MAKQKTKVEFCGAFNGWGTLRDGETVEQFLERVESGMQRALDRTSGHVVSAIDYGDTKVTTE